MEVCMGGGLESPQLFDRIADNGEALTRGYLELVLDEQHCEGASPQNADGSDNLTLTLYVLDRQETPRDHFVFATRIRKDDTDSRKAQRLLIRLMDRLTNQYGISTYVQPGELHGSQLDRFRSEVEYATLSWVD
jgi:hypothetical protein